MTMQITCIVKICCKDHILSQKVKVSDQNEMIYMPKSIQLAQIKFCCASFCCLHTWTNTENLEWFRALCFPFTIQVRLDILYPLILPTCWFKLSDHFFNACLEWFFQKKSFVLFHTQVDKMNWNYQWPEKKNNCKIFFHCKGSHAHIYRNCFLLCGPISCNCTASIQTLGTKV